MAGLGLDANVYEDVSQYEKPINVWKVPMPARMVKALAASAGCAVAIGLYLGFVWWVDPVILGATLPVLVGAPGFFAGFYSHKGLKPEEWLPYKLRCIFGGRHIIRTSESRKADVGKASIYKEYAKAKKTRESEIALPLLDAALRSAKSEERTRSAQKKEDAQA